MDELEFHTQPNDAYFKAVFSDLRLARPFFKRRLPQELSTQMDWSTLALKPGSYVKRSLQQSQSDLLFSVRMGEQSVLLYLLFEHQTTVDPTMRLRLLGYMLEILQTHQREHGLPLPAVLPLVLNQGPERWTVSTCFEDAFALPETAVGLLRYLPKFEHALIDLTQLDPDQDEDHAELKVALQLMKMARMKQ